MKSDAPAGRPSFRGKRASAPKPAIRNQQLRRDPQRSRTSVTPSPPRLSRVGVNAAKSSGVEPSPDESRRETIDPRLRSFVERLADLVLADLLASATAEGKKPLK